MIKRWPLHRCIAGLPIVLCLLSMTVAGATFANCRAPQSQVAFNPPWDDPRPSAIQSAADVHVWKTITIGAYRDLPTLRAALREAGCGIGDDVDAMLVSHAFPLAHDPKEIDLVVLSVAQLGFPSEASRTAIFARAEELGLQLCPPEVGLLLRLQYPDQLIGEFLTIAMKPIHMANGELEDMTVANGGAGQLLIAGQAPPNQTLSWNELLVFARKSSDASITARH